MIPAETARYRAHLARNFQTVDIVEARDAIRDRWRFRSGIYLQEKVIDRIIVIDCRWESRCPADKRLSRESHKAGLAGINFADPFVARRIPSHKPGFRIAQSPLSLRQSYRKSLGNRHQAMIGTLNLPLAHSRSAAIALCSVKPKRKRAAVEALEVVAKLVWKLDDGFNIAFQMRETTRIPAASQSKRPQRAPESGTIAAPLNSLRCFRPKNTCSVSPLSG